MQATKKQKLDVESIEHPHLNIPTENIIQSESTEKTDISILKETEQTKDIDILKETKETKQSKRRVALFLGYNGLGYTGMQINTPQKTIEQALHNALALSHAVSSQNANDPKKINFARCARTDKGVHALGQCVSLNMIVGDEGIVERINEHLPKQIRVWGYVPTTKSFHAKVFFLHITSRVNQGRMHVIVECTSIFYRLICCAMHYLHCFHALN